MTKFSRNPIKYTLIYNSIVWVYFVNTFCLYHLKIILNHIYCFAYNSDIY